MRSFHRNVKAHGKRGRRSEVVDDREGDDNGQESCQDGYLPVVWEVEQCFGLTWADLFIDMNLTGFLQPE
jgi:hypothetical protein